MPWTVLDLAKLQSWSAHQYFCWKFVFHTENERKGKDESNEGFFEGHWNYARAGEERCFNLKKKHIFYTFLSTCVRTHSPRGQPSRPYTVHRLGTHLLGVPHTDWKFQVRNCMPCRIPTYLTRTLRHGGTKIDQNDVPDKTTWAGPKKTRALLTHIFMRVSRVVWRNGILSEYGARFWSGWIDKMLKPGVVNFSADTQSSRLRRPKSLVQIR